MFGLIQEENLTKELVEEIKKVHSRRLKESEYFTARRYGSGLFVIDYEEGLDFLPDRNDYAFYVIVEELEEVFIRTILAIKLIDFQTETGIPMYIANSTIGKGVDGEPEGEVFRPPWLAITNPEVVEFESLLDISEDDRKKALSAHSGYMLLNFFMEIGTVDIETETFTPFKVKLENIEGIDVKFKDLEDRIIALENPQWGEF